MIYEKSCGAVVFKRINDTINILIEKMKRGHFSLPKGHVEDNETESETAIREIKEETNLDVNLDTNFREVVTYSPYEGCTKDVIFFVAEAKNPDEIINQEAEVSEILWLDPYDALDLLTHDSDKVVLHKALAYIKGTN